MPASDPRPSLPARFAAAFRTAWPVLRWPFWLGCGLACGFLIPYTMLLDRRVQERFGDLVFSQPTRVYARPLPLAPGEPMNADTLRTELAFAGYQPVSDARVPGSWSPDGTNAFVIASRGYADPDGGELPRRVRLTLSGGAVGSLTDLTARRPLKAWHLDPARIATLYGAEQEEREVVKLDQLPPLLISGLQAVEDRDFGHHIGIDFTGIARAFFANLRAGHVVQGGSTLTQQLVRDLFLDRNQNYVRKFNEALLSVLITAHYSRERILDAYVNEVFLGQQGGQAVHGFAAASKFYFGRPLQTLQTQDIALLVGLVRGPSYYDPRRYPGRALARRNEVLTEFNATGLISVSEMQRAQAAPLAINPDARLPRDRFPAFMDLVRRQLAQDFSSEQLRGGGLAVYTTLDPATQLDAEQALAQTLDGLGPRGAPLQGAVVVTDAHNGQVLALVGGRDPGAPGFNRALDARRQVGSTIKPFVYLVALAQPQQWTLATLLDDSPLSIPQRSGTVWTPQNDDHQSHGMVPLVDALAHSWNIASVRLGLAVGLPRVVRLLESFGLTDVNSNPSLILGAQDLAPFQLAQMYQYFAADGHALPLIAVRGVLDAHAKLLKRYEVQPGPGEYQLPARLVTYALQQVAVEGTAAALAQSPLAWLHAAGKTGTSENQRDSWFAGFTGRQLAVVWVGRDDNKPTPLWGATGALRVWMRLFEKLPTRALPPVPAGLQLAWIDPTSGHLTEPVCPGARQLPFIPGSAPTDEDHCLWQELKSIFTGGSPAPAASSPPPH